MLDYATFQRIQHLHRVEQLTVAQIALAMAMDARTVRRWLDEPQFRARATPARPSKLDPYKAYIRRLLEHHPYSAVQLLNRLREAGYDGGVTIVKDYVQRVRPVLLVRAPAFLTLHFAPGECAQVDWGHYASVNVGNTRRRLSFFVMVLCYSRLMYLEFTVSQTMEHFLGCHVNAFEAFAGRVPAKIMVDNLKSAVLQRSVGQAPVFNPRYADFARHHRFEIAPCNVRAGHEKGRVEAGVGYVKKNFLAGLDIPDFRALNPAARQWLDSVANVRIHGETHKRPLDLFALERDQLRPLPELLYDIGAVHTVRVARYCHRVRVPPRDQSGRRQLGRARTAPRADTAGVPGLPGQCACPGTGDAPRRRRCRDRLHRLRECSPWASLGLGRPIPLERARWRQANWPAPGPPGRIRIEGCTRSTGPSQGLRSRLRHSE